MESNYDLSNFGDLDVFMMITPIPQIDGNINFLKMFVVDIEEVALLQEAWEELKSALVHSVNDIAVCIRLAETYLERLTTLDEPVRKTKQVIKWKKVFTDLGKSTVSIQVKHRSHLKVEIYMVRNLDDILGSSDTCYFAQNQC